MQYPVEFSIGAWTVPAHLLFEMLAWTGGYRLYTWLRQRQGDRISDENRFFIFIGAAAGALIGSHTLGVLERPLELPDSSLTVWITNKTILGGLLGGLIGVETTKKLLGVRVSSGDLITYPLILGMAVGRIGCHLAGLEDGTHGLPANLPWAVDFGDGILRHPVNMYEIVFLATLGLSLWQLEKRKSLSDGVRFKLFMVAYLSWRFFLEWLKPVYLFPFGLSTLQIAALLGLIYYRKTLLNLSLCSDPTSTTTLP